MRDKATDAVDAPKEQTQVPYVPRSQGRSMNTLIPRNMASSAQVALGRLEQQHGNIDEFVRARLGYTSTDELHRRLYAEQIDNIGLAISNLDKGNGFVIGDQTGIGKGCQCAALMSYGARQGKPVVFLTQKSALYKDILRDLDTIGVRDFTPFITDSNAKITVEGGSVLRTGSNAQQDQEMKRLMGLGNLGSYDAVFTTYSQIQTVKQKEPFRRDFLRSLAERGAIFICDESHEAGGSPQTAWQSNNAPLTRAEFMRELIDTALESGGGVVYSSATYSKRPDVMDLYARSTDLRYAVGKNRSLEVTLRVGGVPLQQVIAAKYVKSGQMMRRERSFEGISFQTLTVPADKETADQFSAAMRAINSFDRVKKKQIRKISKDLKKEAKLLKLDNAIGDVGAKSTNFTSLMHNCIEQGLLAQKADATVQASLEVLQSGAKPVIALDNTMGAFIDAWVETHDAKPGDRVTITFSDLLERYLERSRDVSISNHRGKQDRRPLTDEELGPDGVAAYLEAREIIRDSDLSKIPISPIDYIKGQLEQAGYTTTEVTGRKSVLKYAADGSAIYQTRSGKEVSTDGKIAAVNHFNSGAADVIIINRSGSTGISLHASERFSDQRPRQMIVAQASRDINTFMQTLGRVHRTGQVALPNYTLLTTDLPAEKRPAAVLSRKMATLNANVTADRETATSIQGVVDFFNEYGEEVVAQLLEEMPELNEKLDDPLGKVGDKDLDLVAKVTGRIPLLPIEEQERTYQLIETAYQDLVAQKEAMGESLLQADQLNLDARTIARMEIVPADTQIQNEFSGPVYLEVIDAKSLSKPLTQVQVANHVRDALGVATSRTVTSEDWQALGDRGHEQAQQRMRELKGSTGQYRAGKLATLEALKQQQLAGLPQGEIAPAQEKIDKLTGKLAQQLEFVTKQLQEFPVGASVRITRQKTQKTLDVLYGVVIGMEHKDRGSAPSVPSSWHMSVALSNGEVKSMTIPLSALDSSPRKSRSSSKDALMIQTVGQDMWSGKSVYELFDTQQHDVRQQRQVMTGNLVKACDRYPEGKLLNFTDYKGRIRQGLLLPKTFDIAEKLRHEPVPFHQPYQGKAFLTELTSGKGGLKTLDGVLTVRLHRDGESLLLETPRTKESGGKYYLNATLIDRIGQEFVSHQDNMRAVVPPENAEQTLNYIMAGDQLACFDPKYLEVAREYMGVKIPTLEEAPDGGVLEVEDDFVDDNVVPYVDEPTAGDRRNLEALFERAEDSAISPERSEDSAISPETSQEGAISPQQAEADAISPEPDKRSPETGPPAPASEIALSPKQPGLPEKWVSKFLHEAGLAQAVLEGKDFHLKIENEPYTPLVVEAHDIGQGQRQLYLTHYLEQNGDLFQDGEMVFNVSTDGVLQLDQTATQDFRTGGEYRVYDGGDRTFAQMLAGNIRAQGFAEAARQQQAKVAEAENSEPIQQTLIEPPSPSTDYQVDTSGIDPSWGNPEPTPVPEKTELPVNPEPKQTVARPILNPPGADVIRANAERDREDQVIRARAMDLEQVAVSLGMTRHPHDKSKWKLDGHSISISAEKGLFNDWHAHEGGSGAIDLVLHVNDDWSFNQAVEWLTQASMVQVPSLKEAQAILEAAQQPKIDPLDVPKPDAEKWSQVYEYLTRERSIPAGLVNQAFQQGKVFADERGNAVFPMQQLQRSRLFEVGGQSNDQAELRAGAISGYAKRGTESDFKHISRGSSKADGWFSFKPGQGSIHRIVLTESPIEALSLTALEQDSQTLYLGLNGNSPLPVEQLQRHIEQGGEVITAFNNDAAGLNLSVRVVQQLPAAKSIYPQGKYEDWNQQLAETTELVADVEQDILTAPPLEELRDWYRKASVMQRGPAHLKQIAKLGRGEAEFDARAHSAISADNRAFALSERFTQQAQLILEQHGVPQTDGSKVVAGEQYQLRGSPDGRTLSVRATDRGSILEVQGGILKAVALRPQDINQFEAVSAQVRVEMLQVQRSQAHSSTTAIDHER